MGCGLKSPTPSPAIHDGASFHSAIRFVSFSRTGKRSGELRRFRRKVILKDSLLEGVEFELSGDFLNGQ